MFKGKKIYTIIPARGGSKSLPRKNILPLNGKPLISYTINYSLKSRIVDRTIVSTDDLKIAEVSKKYGAEVPFIRPVKYATDTTQDFPVIHHSLEWLRDNEDKVPDFVVLLRPTSPLRPKGLIEKSSLMLLNHKDADSVRSVALCSEHPYRMWKVGKAYMSPFITRVYEPYNIPRQQLPRLYYQTGDIETIRSSTILDKKSVSGKNILPILLDKKNMVDIDTKKDLNQAKKMLKK